MRGKKNNKYINYVLFLLGTTLNNTYATQKSSIELELSETVANPHFLKNHTTNYPANNASCMLDILYAHTDESLAYDEELYTSDPLNLEEDAWVSENPDEDFHTTALLNLVDDSWENECEALASLMPNETLFAPDVMTLASDDAPLASNTTLSTSNKTSLIFVDADLEKGLAASMNDINRFIQVDYGDRVINLQHYHVLGDGNCGFYAIGKKREEVADAVEEYLQSNQILSENVLFRDKLKSDLIDAKLTNYSDERLMELFEIDSLFSGTSDRGMKLASIKKIKDRIRGDEYAPVSFLAICAKKFKFNLHIFTKNSNGNAQLRELFEQSFFNQPETNKTILILNNSSTGLNAHYDLLVDPDQSNSADEIIRGQLLEQANLGQTLDRRVGQKPNKPLDEENDIELQRAIEESLSHFEPNEDESIKQAITESLYSNSKYSNQQASNLMARARTAFIFDDATLTKMHEQVMASYQAYLTAYHKHMICYVEAPHRSRTPMPGYISFDQFFIIPMRLEFFEKMTSFFSDPKTMQYYTTSAEIWSTYDVKTRYNIEIKDMHLSQKPDSFIWAVVNQNGIYGQISACLVELTKSEAIYSAARILSPDMQGKKQGKQLLQAMFDYLPDATWQGTVDVNNVASWKSEEAAGFVFQHTYEEGGCTIKKYKRSSNDTLEANKKIRFTYSGKVAKLSDLMEHSGNKFIEDFHNYKEEADKGNMIAQYEVAKCYANGMSVDKDLGMAAFYYEKATNKGHAESHYQLAQLLWAEGSLYCKEAIDHYKIAAQKNHGLSLQTLGNLNEYGMCMPINHPEAFKYYTRAKECGDIYSSYLIGRCYEYAIGTEQNLRKAARSYVTSANLGVVEAMLKLSQLFFEGKGVRKNPEKAVSYMHAAAKKGNAEALYQMSELFFKGEFVKQDKEKALRYLISAAEAGNIEANYLVGLRFYTGEGVDQNFEKAIACLQKAADAKHTQAAYMLKEYYEQHKSVKVSLLDLIVRPRQIVHPLQNGYSFSADQVAASEIAGATLEKELGVDFKA